MTTVIIMMKTLLLVVFLLLHGAFGDEEEATCKSQNYNEQCSIEELNEKEERYVLLIMTAAQTLSTHFLSLSA